MFCTPLAVFVGEKSARSTLGLPEVCKKCSIGEEAIDVVTITSPKQAEVFAMISTLRSVQPMLLRSARAQSVMRSPSLAALSSRRSFGTTSTTFAIAKRFTAEHEWVEFDDEANIGKIGITDYAQKALGDVVYVELPSEGSEVKQGGKWKRERDLCLTTTLTVVLHL